MLKMFKSALVGGMVASTALLGSCATTGTTIPIAIQDVQQAAVAACGFLPLASTVTQLLAANDPAFTSAIAVAQAICAAVTPPAPAPGGNSARRAVNPSVDGVIIKGQFVQ